MYYLIVGNEDINNEENQKTNKEKKLLISMNPIIS